MITHYSKTRLKRKRRLQARIRGTGARPRVSVFRSQSTIYAQIIDDETRSTLVGGSDRVLSDDAKNKVRRAFLLGKWLAAEAGKKKVKTVVFDRNGYTYHGRVKALAEGLREGGLVF